ncbi:MAG TPA: GNAT family N-acetyltransferase [Bacteroidales bacterium]|jgi:GNAT superfamily N-acetyltransferase|nr:GNAT family N-acetyltransferase [Bacteroidales bacterium]
MTKINNIKISPVTKTNWTDFESLFQSKGAPGYCWCMAWRMTKEELKNNNRGSRKEYIKQRIGSETPIGLLAYSENEPVGWCSIAPRETYQRLGGDETIEKVWSLVCFFIKKEFRDKGLIDLLIKKAKEYAQRNGAKFIEAYPVETDSPSYRFMGFIKTFEKAGFNFVKKAGTRRHVMIHKLK